MTHLGNWPLKVIGTDGPTEPDEQVEWTLASAPAAGEPHSECDPSLPQPTPRSPSRRSHQFWVWLGALPVLALLATGLYSQFEHERIRRQVDGLVAQQEQARLYGNWSGLRSYYAEDSTGWANQQLAQWRDGRFLVPVTLPGLQAGAQPGHIGHFQLIGSQLVRADVIRSFQLPDGTPIRLALPQFYRFAAGHWQQVPPPDPSTDPAHAWHGVRVNVTYPAADADWAVSLAQDLDHLLAQACADWDCPADVRVPVRFEPADGATEPNPPPFDSLLGSLTFELIFAHQTAPVWRAIHLPTRLAGGYPADAPAETAVRRAVSIEALLVVAQRLAPQTTAQSAHPYLDALVVREAVRLGLEPPQLAETQTADPLFGPDALWALHGINDSDAGAWPQALAILNQVLSGRGINDEQHLIHGFDTAPDPQGWLAAGLGLTPQDPAARLVAAAAFDAPVPPMRPALLRTWRSIAPVAP